MDTDFLILADGAQVAGDKLYVLGGGWSVIWSREFPVSHPTSVALGMMVDWQETNQKHSIQVALLTQDGQPVGEPLITGEFDVGRPPGIPAGTAQRFMIAASVRFELPEPGTYQVVVRLDGTDIKSASFTAVKAAQLAVAG